MATIIGGPQYGVKYTLTGPDGTIAVFNDSADPNYVGVLGPETSGLDSADVRESADDLVEMDGGIHGSFYYGRRPIVLNGQLAPPVSTIDRNTKASKLRRASNALRQDAILKWTPDGGVEQFCRVRRQAPLRITGGWVKNFQLPLVSADHRVYSTALTTVSVDASGTESSGRAYPKDYPVDYGLSPGAGEITIDQQGDSDSPAVIRVYGPGVNPQITNTTLGQTISLLYTMSDGEYLSIDTANRTILLNGATNRYSALDFDNTEWWFLIPGTNLLTLRYFSYSAGAKMEVDYRDAWI